MPYTESDYPAQIKDLPKHGREIWIKAYNNAYDNYDPEKDQQYDKKKSKAKNREAYAARVAWGAVKKKYKKNADGKWVAKALSFEMAITKTVIKNGQRRFFATASSDRIDLLGERLDPSIFDDFVHNFEKGDRQIYVDIAHWSYYFPELRSLVYVGELDRLYRDGRYLKAWGFVYDDNKIADAAWAQMERAARGELDYEIRSSVGFLPDYGNVGYENDIFTYRGGRDKAYMDHLGITAFPANVDADIVPEEVAMATKSKGPTLAEDAQRVLGDPELVEELEEARKKTSVQKATADEGIVLKAEEEDAEPEEEAEVEEEELGEQEAEPEAEEEPETEEEPEAQPEAVKAATDAEKKAQQKRAKASGIAVKDDGNVTMPKKWRDAGVPDTNTAWGDWTNYKYPLHDEEHVRNAASRIAQAKNRKGYSAKELSKIEGRIDKAKKKFKVGEYREKAITYVEEVGRPYGGATTIEEAQSFIDAAKDEQKVWDDWYMFQSVAENILTDEQIEDKRASMTQAIGDFKEMLATKSLVIQPEEESREPSEEPHEPETKTTTEQPPAEEPTQEAPSQEAQVKSEPETPPPASPHDLNYPVIKAAKSFADLAEMIMTQDADMRTKRAAMGEALVQTAATLEAVMTPESKVAPQIDTEVIVKAIEVGIERAMAKVMERVEPQADEERPTKPKRKSATPIQPSSIITRGQTFGEIVDRLISGQV